MPNLRIISDNAVSRASLTASTTAGSLAAANLLTDIKGDVWRSTSTAATLTADWAAGESVGCVALPHTNLTPAATIRVRAYSDAGITLLYDSGITLACPASPVKLQGWATGATGVNAYAFGGGSAARLWFSPVVGIKQVSIDLSDTGNSAGYIEASRLIIGDYWSPTYNAETGATLTFSDAGTHLRNDAGDLMTNIGTRSRKLSISLAALPPADRTAMANIIRGNGKASPIFISLHPQSGDAELERDYELHCKLSDISEMALQFAGIYSTPLVLEEI